MKSVFTMSDFIHRAVLWNHEFPCKIRNAFLFIYLFIHLAFMQLKMFIFMEFTFVVKHSLLKEEADLVSTGNEIVLASL